MVKNLPSIERSTKIRLGKYIPEDQANNTIIFNATDALLPDTSTSNSTYIAPIRGKGDSESGTFNVLAYKTGTHEIVDTKLTTDDVGRKSLQDVTDIGSTTTHPIGLSNTNPQDTLSIGNRIFMNKSSSDYGIKITDQGKLLIDGVSNGNEVQVSGTIHATNFTGSRIGLSNTEPTDSISIGNEGQTILNIPSETVYALKTSGNLYAQNYTGDGGLLSNVTLQTVTDKSNITSNTLLLTNPTTSLKAYSNIIVDGKISVGTPIETTSGGTGHDTYIPGTILYGTDTGTSLGRLVPAVSNQDAGKFLRLDGSDIPEWAEVPLTLDAVLGDTTAISDGSMNLTGTGTTITTVGKIKAATFEGSGSGIHNINAANVVQVTNSTLSTDVLPIVPVTKGGTGLDTVTTGDILYASGADQIASLAKGAANKVLQMDSSANIPEWTSTITGATFSGPTLSGVITTPGLNINSIPFINGGGQLVSGTKLQFDGVDTMTVGSNLNISGNLLVQGNTTFQHTQNHTISDPLIELGNANASDTIDLGVIMTRPTANVVAGYMGNEKKYVIAYTLSDPLSPHIVPTNATSDQFMTLSVEGGNVLAGNVITTSPIEMSSGGTGLTSVAQNELLLGPASGTALQTLPPYSPAGTTIEYPTSALSSSANSGETIAGITYTTTASSNQYGQIWKAFDKTTPGQNTFWHSDENVYDGTSGAYTGSKSLGGVSGEWIKLQLSTGIAPASVNITGRTSYDNQAPDSWEILGSTDNTSWTSLLSSTVHATYNGGSGHTVSISGASAYTYLALVVKAKGGTGQTAVVLSELRFFASSANLSKKFLRSSGTGIAWDDVSSTLQTITDGGATTTQTVAFNNTTTGLTSAGDIDIAATKQIDYAGDVLLKSSAGAVSSLKVTNAIKLDPGPSPSPTTVPAAMTANSSGGNTASSGDSSVDAYKAFDGSDSTHYLSPVAYSSSSPWAYTGSNSLGGVNGEWIVVQLASAITPTSVFVKSKPNGTNFASRPNSWRIMGSNNGTNWTQLHASTTVVDDSSGTTESFANTTAYSYLGIVVTNLSNILLNDERWTLSRLSFTDTSTLSPTNNVLSFNTSTGEIYDSGGQGGSTLDNIHEEGSNVAIGPSAASANLTVNTYGSNVLTVSGNVSADNITIGGLNVAASPFGLDDVVSSEVGSNVTSNVIQLTATGNAFVTTNNIKIGKDVHAGGNVYSQNFQLTNTQITASFTSGSGTITIDAKNKSYGTAPLISIDEDVAILDVTNLPNGGQVVVPLLATGASRKVLKTITTGIDFIAFTSDVSIDQDSHGLLTVSKIGASGAEKIYMNAISFAVA